MMPIFNTTSQNHFGWVCTYLDAQPKEVVDF